MRARGDVELEGPCAGRSPTLRGEFCAGAFEGRFELPKPCGARPRSVEFPCASQVRELFPDRCGPLLITLLVERFELGIAEGGRFCESSRCRPVIPELAGEFPARPFAVAFPLTPESLNWPFTLAVPLAEEFPKRPAVIELPFIVRTGA